MIQTLWILSAVFFTFFPMEEDIELKMIRRKWKVVNVVKEVKVFSTAGLPSEIDFSDLSSQYLVKRPGKNSILQGKNFYHEILYLTADSLKLGFHFISEEKDRVVFTFDCIPQN